MKYRNKILFLCFILIIGLLIYNNKMPTKQGFESNLNILGTPMQACSKPQEKTTGYYRNGYCVTGITDTGTHVVCAVVDNVFLQFTKTKGNDLISPQASFPGLVSGDKWCLCALRWKEAHDAGKAPKIVSESTNDVAKQYMSKEVLMKYAV